jgi:hypothetical protein
VNVEAIVAPQHRAAAVQAASNWPLNTATFCSIPTR